MSGVCSAGLATTALPAASAAATWPMKIASGKFHGLMQTKTPRPTQAVAVLLAGRAGQDRFGAEMAAGFRGVVAAEIGGLADFRHAVVERLAALVREQRQEAVAVLFDQIGGALERCGALVRRRPLPGLKSPAAAVSIAAEASDGSASATVPDKCLAIRRRENRAAATFALLSADQRRGIRESEPRPRRSPCVSAARSARLPNSTPREFLRAPKIRSGSGILAWRADAPSEKLAAGGTSRVSTGTAGSLTALTKDEFAPFSRSRRTR